MGSVESRTTDLMLYITQGYSRTDHLQEETLLPVWPLMLLLGHPVAFSACRIIRTSTNDLSREREGGCSFFNIVRNLVRLSEKCCNDVLWQKCDKGFLETLHSCNSTKAVMVALLKILAPRLVTIFVCYTVPPRPGKGMVNILFVFERCSQLMANGKPWEIHQFSFYQCSMIWLVQWHSRSVHSCWTGFESQSSQIFSCFVPG